MSDGPPRAAGDREETGFLTDLPVPRADFTLAEMQPEPRPPSPLLAALVGALGSLALLALASVVACLACRRRHQRPPLAKPPPEERGLEDGEDRGTEEGEDRGTEDGDHRGPDVVTANGKGEVEGH